MIYAYGAVFRSKRRLLGMGLDSAAVVILYIVGVVGLLAFPR
jgi:cation:H+ antiporter